MIPANRRTLAVAAVLLLTTAGAAVSQSSSTPPDKQATSSAPSGAAPTGPAPRALAAAREAYDSGARALDSNHLDIAAREFARAADLDPGNLDYRIGAQLVVEHQVTALVQRAAEAGRAGHAAEAAALFGQAQKLDPDNSIVVQHVPAAAAPRLVSSVAASPDATPPFASDNQSDPVDPNLAASGTIGGELRLAPTAGKHTFAIRGDVRQALTEVFSAWGIRAALDDSVVPQQIRFNLDDVTFAQAVPLLLQMGRLYAVPLDAHTVLIAKDTAELRTRFERQLEETVYIPGYGTEQLNEIGNVLRNIFDIRQVAVLSTSGKLVVRAPAATMHAVNTMLTDLIDGGSEVLIDLHLYTVDRSRTRQIGPDLPQQFGAYNVASTAQSLVSSNQSLVDQAIAQGLITLTGNATTDLIREAVFLIASGAVQSSLLTNTLGFFGGGLTLTGLTAGPAAFNFAYNSSEARELDNVQVRASDRQNATFRSGTRYPITTSTYSTGVSSSTTSALAGVTINGVSASSLLSQFLGTNSGTTIPQIQYEDLGLTLKAVPIAQKSGDVSMKIDLKIEALAGSALNNIPILASREFQSDITLRDGETALMVSSLTKQESLAVSGIPGLGELPGFQSATADRTSDVATSELVLLITPHVVRRRPDMTAGPRIAFSSAPDQRE